MRTKRVLKFLFWIGILVLSIFFRFYYEPDNNTHKTFVVHTILNLCILLVSFKTIISASILFYKLDRRSSSGGNPRDNLIIGMKNLFTILSVISIFLGLLSIIGFDLKSVFTSLSIVAAGLAIVSKDFITEITVGLINGFSRKIEIDDYVKVGDQKGKIIDLGLQKVTLLNDDDDIVYIPNFKFYNSEILNYTKRDIRRMSVSFQLDLKYLNNIEELEKDLIDAIGEFKDYIEEGSFNLKISEIFKDHLSCKFQYTMKEVNRDLQRQIRKYTLRRIVNRITYLKKEASGN